MIQQRVLVTGGSGFIAGYCVLLLLEQGYLVRTTVRSLGRVDAVRAVLAGAGLVNGDALSFVAADLTSDTGWADAVAGCDFVLHVASPVRPGASWAGSPATPSRPSWRPAPACSGRRWSRADQGLAPGSWTRGLCGSRELS